MNNKCNNYEETGGINAGGSNVTECCLTWCQQALSPVSRSVPRTNNNDRSFEVSPRQSYVLTRFTKIELKLYYGSASGDLMNTNPVPDPYRYYFSNPVNSY
jgi:hypothetical protein